MTSIRESLRRRFAPTLVVPPGFYHYQSPPDDARNFRLHLRVEQDGRGLLILNAATVLHLNRTAVEFAHHFMQGNPADTVVQQFSGRVQAPTGKISQDYADFIAKIYALLETPDLDPVLNLDLDWQTQENHGLSAPFRLDLALTYRQAGNLASLPDPRVERELTTAEWKRILQTAWSAGIPQVIFTGTEPTGREDLLELLAFAEQTGLVAGLVTHGSRLQDPEYLRRLLQTGLDHLVLILEPEQQPSLQILDALLQPDLFLTVHLTIHQGNVTALRGILESLAAKGLRHLSASAEAPGYRSALQEVQDFAVYRGMDIVWDLPVPFGELNTVNLETHGADQFTGKVLTSLYLEPDGDVLIAQGVYQVLGNILREPFEQIWERAKQMVTPTR